MHVSDTQSKGCFHTTASWEASEEGGRQRILVSGADMEEGPLPEGTVFLNLPVYGVRGRAEPPPTWEGD